MDSGLLTSLMVAEIFELQAAEGLRSPLTKTFKNKREISVM